MNRIVKKKLKSGGKRENETMACRNYAMALHFYDDQLQLMPDFRTGHAIADRMLAFWKLSMLHARGGVLPN